MHLAITSEIFQVGGSGYTAPEDAAIYLICFNGKSALVDAGCGNYFDSLYVNISECGVDPKAISYLLLTHCHYDHTGGAAAIHTQLGCKIFAHKLDAQFLENGDNKVTAASWYGATLTPFPVGHKISGKQTDILLGDKIITAIHTPGHSPGSLVFLTESDGKKVLFGQDVHGPLAPDFKSDRKAYKASLAKLMSLDADILCEGHFGIYSGKDKIRRFIKSFL